MTTQNLSEVNREDHGTRPDDVDPVLIKLKVLDSVNFYEKSTCSDMKRIRHSPRYHVIVVVTR